MEFLEYLKLGPLTTGQAFFLMWFFGAVGGYCFGRAHAAYISLGSLSDRISATVERLNKDTKNVK